VHGAVWQRLARTGSNGQYDVQRLQKMGSFEIVLEKTLPIIFAACWSGRFEKLVSLWLKIFNKL
jgi:hypothetical protein